MHQVASYQHLVRALGFPSGPIEPRIDGVGRSPRRRRGRARGRAAGMGATPLVALAPGAAYGGAKRWPPASFAALARALAARRRWPVLVGSAGDTRAGREIRKAAARLPTVMNLIGRTDLAGAGRRARQLPRRSSRTIPARCTSARRSASA